MEQSKPAMTHLEGIQRLQTISRDAVRLLHHLEDRPRTGAREAQLRQYAATLKKLL